MGQLANCLQRLTLRPKVWLAGVKKKTSLKACYGSKPPRALR
ncbi:hypothetical protein EV13_2030 [Prochlorococcus sp. MIT 0702]|nr:hypothetical protein EV13_2030 [Prochlorococcus sp. MIT 0702]KGG28189.1 hypothetical protein EV12_0939 [Prochlorococcus sp. MIT 0701]KGG37239.1 hypothetical protein EV14_0031 [Prochlorococcus sp. MIT 0703]